jgi:hypothetical protein
MDPNDSTQELAELIWHMSRKGNLPWKQTPAISFTHACTIADAIFWELGYEKTERGISKDEFLKGYFDRPQREYDPNLSFSENLEGAKRELERRG